MSDERTNVDVHSAEFARDFVGTVHRLQSRCPVAWTDAQDGMWLVTGHDEIVEVARDHARFSSDHDPEGTGTGYRGVGVPPTPFQGVLHEMDDPQHAAYRRVLTPFFSNTSIDRWAPDIDQVCMALIDRVVEHGSCDIVVDVAAPLMAILTFRMIGAPETEWELFSGAVRHWLSCPPGSDGYLRGLGEYVQVASMLAAFVERRLAGDEQPHDLMTAIRNARPEGRPMTPDEMQRLLSVFYVGGVDTTAQLIASSVAWLGEHPDRRAELASRPDLLGNATEEFLRLFGTSTGLARTATHDTEVAGQSIREGDRLYVMWAAGGLDERTTDRPLDVDFERRPVRHTAFGVGSHRCIGASLATRACRIVLGQVLERMPDYRVDGENARAYDSIGVVRGWTSLPLTFTPGPRLLDRGIDDVLR